MADEHAHKRASWVAVGLLVLASVLLGIAFILKSIPLAILAVVVGIAGAVAAKIGGLMEDAY